MMLKKILEMKLSKSKGKVHPSLSSSSSSSSHDQILTHILPTAILALISVLSLEDREALAYLITQSLKSSSYNPSSSSEQKFTPKKKSTKKSSSCFSTNNDNLNDTSIAAGNHKIPSFDCFCFECFSSFWNRWNSSPHRELIDQAIEAFEEHLASTEKHKRPNKSKNNNSAKNGGNKRREKAAADVEERDLSTGSHLHPDSEEEKVEVVACDVEERECGTPEILRLGDVEERENECLNVTTTTGEAIGGGDYVEERESGGQQKKLQQQLHKGLAGKALQSFINAFFDSDSMTKLSPVQQYVLKNSSCEVDKLVDNCDPGVTEGKQKEVLSTSRFIKEAGLSFSALNQFVTRFTYDLEVKVFKEILSDIIRRDHVQFGSTAIVPSTNQTVTWNVQTSGSHIITHAVIRRDQVRNYIVSKLSDRSMDSETLSISPRVGTGGVGNNTLFLLFACIRDDKLWQMIQQDNRLASFWKTTNFIGSGEWTRIEKMKQRRSLFIFELENVNTEADALACNLQSEEYLEELVLEWSATSDDPEKARTVLTALKPHKTLTMLTINNYPGTSLPQWVTDSAFYCLRTLQLNNCSNCISLPYLGELPSLVYLSIKNFHSLQIVGPEFYGDISSQSTPFGTLKILHFEDLPEWQIWVNDEFEGWTFPNLQELSLIECSQLVGKLPAELPSLRKLEILDCEQLNIQLPQLPQLATLKLQKCELFDLATLTNLSSLTSLDMSFEGENNTCVPNLENLTSLSYLRIAGLNNLCTFNELTLPPILETLFISHPVDILTRPLSSSYDSVELLPSLHVLRFLPSSLTSLSIGGFKDLDLPQHSYVSLQYLSIHDCYLSESLHFPLGNFSKLEYLEVKNCFHLVSFDVTSALGHEICLPLLNELSIENCPDLLSFPGEGFAAPNLRTLSIANCKNLLSLPEDMHTCMTSLLSLSLQDCPELDSFPKGGLPLSLQTIRITYCKRLTSNWKQWKLKQLVSLTKLEIQGCEEVECFPPQGWLPASLTTLVIAHFPALVFLIGEALQQLISVQELQIMYCQELLSLPEEGMPPSLKYLGIYFCPFLKERCQRDEGEDWPKISHLPRVTIDFQEI